MDVVNGLNKLRAVSTTELFLASANNVIKVAKWLVEEKTQVLNMCSDMFRCTPLNSVARSGYYKVVKYLISKQELQ